MLRWFLTLRCKAWLLILSSLWLLRLTFLPPLKATTSSKDKLTLLPLQVFPASSNKVQRSCHGPSQHYQKNERIIGYLWDLEWLSILPKSNTKGRTRTWSLISSWLVTHSSFYMSVSPLLRGGCSAGEGGTRVLCHWCPSAGISGLFFFLQPTNQPTRHSLNFKT